MLSDCHWTCSQHCCSCCCRLSQLSCLYAHGSAQLFQLASEHLAHTTQNDMLYINPCFTYLLTYIDPQAKKSDGLHKISADIRICRIYVERQKFV